MFQQNQQRVYQQLNGKIENSEKSDTGESRRFWSNILGTGKSHKKMVTQQIRKVSNWKYPWPDGVQGYWLKNFSALHETIAT